MNQIHKSLVRSIAIGVIAALTVSGLACDSFKVSKFYERGVVATVSPIASRVGCDVLEDGGNAFDAAVAVGFVLAVTYPQAGNLGGGGFAVMRDGQSETIESLDFRETAPAGAAAAMYLDEEGLVNDSVATRGALASGVPGTVAGLHALWERYGSMLWSDLVTPAARLADTGFIVDEFLAKEFADHRDTLIEFEETRAIFAPGGVVRKAGDRFLQPDLARTLYQIAANGPDPFYRGPIADSIVASMERHNGLITGNDLDAYQVVWREPLHFTFDLLDIYSMPPPSSGGIVLGQILQLLEPFDFAGYTPDSPEYIHLFCEASRLAFADRAEHLGDPGFWSVPSGLLNSEYLDSRRTEIDLDRASSSADTKPGNPTKYGSGETTHYSVCDAEGNMVAVTTTLNSYFGSGLAVAGAGFLLNNEMDDFSARPGHPNTYGLVGSEANKIEPGKRMLSSMSPTLILKDERPYLILGSPGGSKIITAVAQAIINFTRFGLTLEETANHPRFHHQWLPDLIYLEEGKFDVATMQRLIRYGHEIKERASYGDLEMIHIATSGLMTGATDHRLGGAVAGCGVPTID